MKQQKVSSKSVKVSVIIPAFNYDRYIARAIRSCIEQTIPTDRFEIVVINDSSDDATRYILESYGHWIKVLENKTQKGLPYCRNHGINVASGEYIVNLDADDYLHPDFLKVCFLYLEFNTCDAVATDYFIVDDNETIVERIDVQSTPIACGIMFRKHQMVDVGLYDTDLHIGEDVDFRLRFEKKYTIDRINLPLYRYRKHGANLTSDPVTNREYLDRVERKHDCKIGDNCYPAESDEE